MDYERGEEKFYELMKEKKDEIKALDISDEEKNELYLFVEEKIQRYVQFKITSLKNQILVAKLNELQKIFNQKLEEIISNTEVILPHIEELIKKQKTNRKILPFPGYIPFSDN